MQLFTIGFTKKSAQTFFTTLKTSGAKTLVDVRLNNVSQLAGFTKRDDLAYFVKTIGGMDYVHAQQLAPTQEMLNEYKKNTKDWPSYERRFLDLLAQREVEKSTPKELIDGACLLCSEPTHERCHRRLVAEYFGKKWGSLQVFHL